MIKPNAKKKKGGGGMKSETPQPAWQLLCSACTSKRAGTLDEGHDAFYSRNPPKWNARAWKKSPATSFCRKKSFVSFYDPLSQLRAGIVPVPPSSQEAASSLRESGAGQDWGSHACSERWLMLFITKELPGMILPWAIVVPAKPWVCSKFIIVAYY